MRNEGTEPVIWDWQTIFVCVHTPTGSNDGRLSPLRSAWTASVRKARTLRPCFISFPNSVWERTFAKLCFACSKVATTAYDGPKHAREYLDVSFRRLTLTKRSVAESNPQQSLGTRVNLTHCCFLALTSISISYARSSPKSLMT